MCCRAGGTWQGALAFALAGSNVAMTARKKNCMMGTPESLMDTLRQKLRELSFMEMKPDAQAIVAELLELTAAGDVATAADIHHPTFDGLIRLAGPGVAHDLLAQLGSDFAEVEQALSAALATQDIMAIRHQTHVLIALAGSIGAEGLLQLAKTLNQMAHLPPQRELTVIGHRLLSGSAQVRSFVAQQLAKLDAPDDDTTGRQTGVTRT